jgi:hypothetical protein
MLRWIILAVVVVGISAAATLLVQYVPDLALEPSSAATARAGPQPKVQIEEPLVYDFGKMSQWDQGSHAWIIKNLGKGDLELWQEGDTSCSCTVAEFTGGEKKANAADRKTVVVKPAGSTKINLVWQTKSFENKYHQYAKVGTNDLSRPIFQIAVQGVVHHPVVAVPPQLLTFESISNEETTRAKIAVFSPDRKDMKITKISTSRPALIEASIEPLPAQGKTMFKVEGGYNVSVRIKPGMPLGKFKDELIIATDHPLQRELRVPIGGNVTGLVSVIPEGLARVVGRGGGSKEVKLVVRGGRPTHFELLRKPDQLEISIEPADGSPPGVYRLRATIPPGTAAGRIDDQIILKSDLPKAGEIKIPVSIYVSNAPAG